MAKDSLNVLERHVDKIVLGLAGAFALAMLWMYMVNSPNRTKYDGQLVGPRALDEKILESANRLQSKVRSAAPKDVTITKYSEQLRSNQQAALIASSARDGGPALPPKLRLAATFGKPIVVPGLEDTEGSGEITLVTPLPPTAPKAIAGRSVAVRTAMTLDGAPAQSDESKKPEEASEFPWVSFACYWDKQAQRTEMTAAKYAAYRTKVYVARVDAQRQEMQATGEFSEWKDVPRSKASLDIPIRDPIFDDQSGAIINKDRIEQSYRQIKDYQQAVVQPMFYPVELGDDWEIPPIEGFADDYVGEGDNQSDEARKAIRDQKKRDREEKRKEQRSSGRRPPQRPSGVRSRGGVGTEGGGGGDGAVGIVARGSGNRGGNSERARKSEALKQIRADLKDARTALKDKDYGRAINLANQAFKNEFANAGLEKKADEIIRAAQRAIDREQRRGQGAQELDFIYNPENQSQMAVWFHDDSVEPGKTYRYRVRVDLWNRYVGQLKAVRDAEEARHSILYGDWSRASDPISVTPSTYFFLSNGTFDRSGVNVDVFKWRQGEWLRERFVDVQIGKVIGEVKKIKTDDLDDNGKPLREDVDFSTGAVVLDLRFAEPVDLRTSTGKKGEFAYRSQPSVVMVYLDPADGQIRERTLAADRHDPLRKKLVE